MRLINPLEGLRLAARMTPAYHATMLTIAYVIPYQFEEYKLVVNDEVVVDYSVQQMAQFFRLSIAAHSIMIFLAGFQKLFI